MSHTRPRPPSHAITRRRTQCQSKKSGHLNSHILIQSEQPTLFPIQPFMLSWYVVRRTVLYDINTILLQHAPNLLNILHIHTGNTNTALDLAITVLNDLDLKQDTVQTENNFPAP